MNKGLSMPVEAKAKMIKTLIKVFAHKAKPIIQTTKDGKPLTEWKSLMEIERVTGERRSHVVDVCKGKRKSAYGCIWKYA
jgi:hypothetical protein